MAESLTKAGEVQPDSPHPSIPSPEGAGKAKDQRIARTRVRAGTLADAVKDVLGASAGKDVVPILGQVLIEAGDGQLELTATNLDLWIVRRLASNDGGEPDSAEWTAGSRSFALTVPAKVLSAVLGELDPDAMVELYAPTSSGGAGPGESRAVLKAGRSRFKLPVLPAGDFPLTPPTPSAASFEIAAAALADHFARVEHAISTEETRYYLTGVYLHPVLRQAQDERGQLRFVATDGHRLARLAVDGPEGAASWPATIIGRHTVALLDKLLAGAAKADEAAGVAVNAVGLNPGSLVVFEMPAADGGEVMLIAKTIDGSFPDYERVIPEDSPVRATIERAVLAAALKRVGVLTPKSSRIVKLVFARDLLTITGSSAELGEATEELPCDLDGGDLTIGFDHQYLRAALLAAASAHVVLAMSDPGGACRIEASVPGDDGAALVQVVMAARV